MELYLIARAPFSPQHTQFPLIWAHNALKWAEKKKEESEKKSLMSPIFLVLLFVPLLSFYFPLFFFIFFFLFFLLNHWVVFIILNVWTIGKRKTKIQKNNTRVSKPGALVLMLVGEDLLDGVLKA